MYYQPLEQFEILVFSPGCPYDECVILDVLSSIFFQTEYFMFSSSVLYAIFCFHSIVFFLISSIEPNRTAFSFSPWEVILEDFYIFIHEVLEEQANETKHSVRFFPLIFSLFIFICFSNLIGLTPYGFTTTSFIFKTFFLSGTLILGLTIYGIKEQGIKFFEIFIPSGVPQALLPMLIVIEIVSYVSRAFSLAIRLFANMMSGHSLLNILSGFCVSLSKKSLILGLVPFIIILAITFLEAGIAILQAYVFIVLFAIYMNDALYGHHEPYKSFQKWRPQTLNFSKIKLAVISGVSLVNDVSRLDVTKFTFKHRKGPSFSV